MPKSVTHRSSTFRRLIQQLRFSLENLILRGLRYRLLLAAVILAMVTLIAGVIIFFLDASISNLGEAMRWAYLRLTDTGYQGDDFSTSRRSVSMIVSLLGLLLYVGLLIALLTHWLDDAISKLGSGLSPIPFSDHVVILGWTYCTAAIVTELLQSDDRVQRFLEGRNVRKLRIVILAPRVDEELVRTVRERLGKNWNDGQVFLRAGTPLQIDHLERVAFLNAAVIILPTMDHVSAEPEEADARTVKTLRAISTIASKSGRSLPLAVAELYDGRKMAVARRAYAGPIEIIAADNIISNFIAQSVRHNGLFDVFAELLTSNQGNALFVRPVDALSGTRFGSLDCQHAILLGIIRSGEHSPTLNPPPDTVLDATDLLVFVARHFADCVASEVQRSDLPVGSSPMQRPVPERRQLLILGWNRKFPEMLDVFRRYGTNVFEIDVVTATSANERQSAMVIHGTSESNSLVNYIEVDFTVPGVLERLDVQRYDNIILLASERIAGEDQVDANTVLTYLMLTELLPEQPPRPELLVELFDEQNRVLFPLEREDVIVSPSIVSHLLSQVSLRHELAAVIRELSQPSGAQIVLKPAQGYAEKKGPQRFSDLQCAAVKRGEVALGIHRTQGTENSVFLNPDRNAEWVFTSSDEVVVLTSYAEPGDG